MVAQGWIHVTLTRGHITLIPKKINKDTISSKTGFVPLLFQVKM